MAKHIWANKCSWANMKRFWTNAWWRHDVAIVTTLGVLVALGGGLFGYYQYSYNVTNQKKEATIQYLVGFSNLLAQTDPILLDIINFWGSKSNYSLHRDTLETILRTNKTYRRQIDNIMVYLNQLAIGCKEDFFDERIALGANSYRIINATLALKPYFDLRVKEEKKGEGRTVCWYLQDMARKWKKNKGKYKKWEEDEDVEVRKRQQEWASYDEDADNPTIEMIPMDTTFAKQIIVIFLIQ
jgi:hypothetical protein